MSAATNPMDAVSPTEDPLDFEFAVIQLLGLEAVRDIEKLTLDLQVGFYPVVTLKHINVDEPVKYELFNYTAKPSTD